MPKSFCMSFYPEEVQKRSQSPASVGKVAGSNANATGASFVCGAFVSLSIRVDEATMVIEAARFVTNGCGFMTAAADVMCGWMQGRELRELHGLEDIELESVVRCSLGGTPADRRQCVSVIFDAVRSAMAGYRRDRIEEFRGDRALICTCFGVDEETIADVIAEKRATGIAEVMRYTKAGSGCGSCRMLIQEILDSSEECLGKG